VSNEASDSSDEGSSGKVPSAKIVAVEPKSGRFESLEAAVVAGGGQIGPVDEATALVWADPARPGDLPGVLESAPAIEWVALPYSGIEPYLGFLDPRRVWTCARGVYARPVAEHAIMLGLAGMRGLATYARSRTWSPPEGVNLTDANVVIIGAGGIAEELISLLDGFNCTITVVRRRASPMDGADNTVAIEDRLAALAEADLVILALALTPETIGIIGAAELAAMKPSAWLVNVARGDHIDLEALVDALDNNAIAGAALDVTSPEPLPDSHPLWEHPRILITPHVANTPEMGVPLLAAHIAENVARFCRGEGLTGVVDIDAGY